MVSLPAEGGCAAAGNTGAGDVRSPTGAGTDVELRLVKARARRLEALLLRLHSGIERLRNLESSRRSR